MVLDTCAVLWLAFNREKITEETLSEIDKCPSLIISTMSFWEIGIKIHKKKLAIPIGFHELMRLYVSHERVSIVPPDLDIIVHALELEWEHRDPVDRIIVATALKFDELIVTSDSIICQFFKKTII